MTILKTAIALAPVDLSIAQIASANDGLYRCADGTFTNRVERQCAPYESKGIVRVQGEGDATKKSFVEVTFSNDKPLRISR